MIIEKDLKKIFQELTKQSAVHVTVDGSDVLLRVFDNASKISYTTPIFEGENYIPRSVRKSLSEKAPFSNESQIRTYLTIDEENFRVYLNSNTLLEETLQSEAFKRQLEEFSWVADKWRQHLDDRGKDDLVYIFVK